MSKVHRVSQTTINHIDALRGKPDRHEFPCKLYDIVKELGWTDGSYIYYIRLSIWAEVTLMIKPKLYQELQLQELLVKEEQEEAKVPFVPRVISGGKDGPSDPTGPEWLKELSIHTTFLAQKRNNTEFPLGQFTIAFKTENSKSVLVYAEGHEKPIWVDPVRFCRDFRLFDIVQTGEEYDLELKANAIIAKRSDDLREFDELQSDRSLRQGDMEDTKTVEGELPFEGNIT